MEYSLDIRERDAAKKDLIDDGAEHITGYVDVEHSVMTDIDDEPSYSYKSDGSPKSVRSSYPWGDSFRHVRKHQGDSDCENRILLGDRGRSVRPMTLRVRAKDHKARCQELVQRASSGSRSCSWFGNLTANVDSPYLLEIFECLRWVLMTIEGVLSVQPRTFV